MRISDWSSDVCSSDLRGATVIGTATSDAGADAIGERLSASGGHGRRLDVNEAGAIEALVDAVGKEFGAISILVNNAGITRDNLLMRMKDEDWQAILDTNLTSVYRSCKAVMRGMMKARKGRRSEEHTSELQSLMRISYAVFCLKTKNTTYHYINTISFPFQL